MAMTLAEVVEIERAALLGTRRRALPIPASLAPMIGELPAERRSLALLALAAQRRRLGAHPVIDAASATVESAPEDLRPIMPEPARGSLRRFIGVAVPSPDLHFSNALAAILNLSGLRMHPHDLPYAGKLDALRQSHGPFEAWWLRQMGARASGTAIDLDVETWTAIRPSALREAMRVWRSREPDAARNFAGNVFSNGSAEQRAALVEAFEIGACPDDAPFLEQAATDKSAKVRESVERISILIPGLSGYQQAVDRLAAALTINRRKRSFGRESITVAFKSENGLNWNTAPRVRLSDLAAALDVAIDELTEAEFHVQTTGMLFSFAAHEGRDDLCEILLARAGERARACLGAASEPFPKQLPLAIRRRLIAPLLDPAVYREPPDNPSETALTLLHALGGPLDGETIRRASRAEGFLKSCALLLERADSADTWAPRGEIIGIAALSPPEAAEAVLEALEPLQPMSTRKDLRSMFAYLRFLADLAKAGIRLSDDPRA